ncbi:MAG: DEAD/DEAH box helicase [Chloroflexi bacterium]|nr:DEAD/DEAH box helicase [Chloroflexota bacterium]
MTLRLLGADLAAVPARWPAAELAGLDPALIADPRRRLFRTQPRHYVRLKARLIEAGHQVQVAFDDRPAFGFVAAPRLTPRPYQAEALDAWESAGCRGVVVLPTGSGKTLVALLAAARLGLRTVVLVPTIDLLDQWRRAALRDLQLPDEAAGVCGGGEWTPAAFTAMTYQSAALRPAELHRFGFLIADEVHHLPADSYRRTADAAWTPFRLGLSATPERGDERHADLDELIGPVVYRAEPAALTAAGHLAPYREERVAVRLSQSEQVEYAQAADVYRRFLRERRAPMASAADFQRLVRQSGADPAAREALLAFGQARRIAFNAEAKLQAVEELLVRHAADRVVVFSESNDAVDALARTLCLPAITHLTPPAERRAILDLLRRGELTKVVTGRVLNEGVDLPECNVAIVLSGNATRLEYVQRLGRILRPKADGGEAILYELVTEETAEVRTAARRRRPVAWNTDSV